MTQLGNTLPAMPGVRAAPSRTLPSLSRNSSLPGTPEITTIIVSLSKNISLTKFLKLYASASFLSWKPMFLTNSDARKLPVGNFRASEFVKNMGFQLKNDAEAYSFKNFVKEMFFDSETMMVVISGVPGKEELRDKDGKV